MRTRLAHNALGAPPFEAFAAARWTASAQISLTPRFFCLACVARVGRKKTIMYHTCNADNANTIIGGTRMNQEKHKNFEPL